MLSGLLVTFPICISPLLYPDPLETALSLVISFSSLTDLTSPSANHATEAGVFSMFPYNICLS